MGTNAELSPLSISSFAPSLYLRSSQLLFVSISAILSISVRVSIRVRVSSVPRLTGALARPIIRSLFAKANEMERQLDQWDLVIKVKHGDTLRRISAHVHGQLMDLNMSKLRSNIISLFKISRDAALILSYTDEDGDIVTLDDDDELRDAVIGQRLNPLRINIQLKSTESSDAKPERSSPSGSVNAPRAVVIPTLVDIPEHEDDDTYLRAYNIPPTNQALHGSRNYWTPAQRVPIHLEDCAGTMDGGSSSKQTSMKGDLSSPSQTVFSAQAKVPHIGGPFGATAYADYARKCSRMLHQDIIDSMTRGFHRGARCDECGMQPIVGPRFKTKGEGGHDLCNICFTLVGNQADYTRIDDAHPRGSSILQPAVVVPLDHTLLEEPQGMSLKQKQTGKEIHRFNEYDHPDYAEWDPLPHSSMKWDSMACSRTVLDGTVMPPSTRFTKAWRLRNSGNVPWPSGTHLVWDGGYQFGDRVSARLEIPQIGVPVDKEIDIAVDFTTPSMLGRCASYWRMAAPNGQKFGQRLWVIIQVCYYSPPNFPDVPLFGDANDVPPDGGFPETETLMCGFPEPSKSWIKPTYHS